MTRCICTDYSERSLARTGALLGREKLPVLVFGGRNLKTLARRFNTRVFSCLPVKSEIRDGEIYFVYRTDCFELRVRQEITSIEQFLQAEKTRNIIPPFMWDGAIATFEADIDFYGRSIKWEFDN